MKNSSSYDEVSEEKTKKLKSIILEQYPSIRAFARASGVAHGTIVSALDKGIDGMAYAKVKRMCECLNVDCATFEPIIYEISNENHAGPVTNRLLEYSRRMVLEQVEVSVIVPIYNSAKTLSQCLDSILNQKYKNFEVICINDGSSDSSYEILMKYANDHSNLLIINKKCNEGLVEARKTGVKNANGRYVTFVDSDDWVDEDYLLSMVNQIKAYDCDVVASAFYRQFENNSVYAGNLVPDGIYDGERMVEAVYSKMLSTDSYYNAGIKGSACAKLYKKDVLLKCQTQVPSKIRNGEDVALIYPLLLESKKVCVMNNAHYHYCQYSTSMSQNTFEERDFLSIKLLFFYLQSVFSESQFSNTLMEQLYAFTSHMIVRIVPQKYDLEHEKFMIYGGIPVNSKLVIYGAGRFGKKMYEYAKEISSDVLWVDKQFEMYQRQGLSVESTDMIYENDFDYLLIAIIDEKTSESIKYDLADNGIEEYRIKVLDIPYIKSKDIIDKILE